MHHYTELRRRYTWHVLGYYDTVSTNKSKQNSPPCKCNNQLKESTA